MRYATLGLFIHLVTAGAHAGNKAIHLLVTPKSAVKFHCRVVRADIPALLEMGQTALRVSVYGGHSPYNWRLPLYRVRNGANEIAAAQVGTSTADADRSFIITVPTYELGRTDSRSALNLEVRSQSGESASCPTPTAPVAASSLARPLRSAME